MAANGDHVVAVIPAPVHALVQEGATAGDGPDQATGLAGVENNPSFRPAALTHVVREARVTAIVSITGEGALTIRETGTALAARAAPTTRSGGPGRPCEHDHRDK